MLLVTVGRSASAQPSVKVGGYLQADAIPWSQDSADEVDSSGKPLNEERVLIRRARLHVDSKQGAVSGALELDGNTVSGAAGRLVLAFARYTFAPHGAPLVVATAGVFKTPFGSEVPSPERDKLFVESPAFARALFPGAYDGGAMLFGEYGVARWTVAMMNGALQGDTQWKGLDPTTSFELIGRLGADVAGPYRSRFVAGVSVLSGRGLHAGTPATKDQLQWVDDNEDGLVESSELTVIPGAPATASQTFERKALGFDAQAHWCICRIGKGMAFVEGVISTNLDRGLVYADPIASSRDVRQIGIAVGVIQGLGDYAQLGLRYDRYDADRDASEREGVMFVGIHKRFSTMSVMAVGRVNKDARLVAQYDHEQNPFGRADNGTPTTRADDRVTLRAQVGF